MNDGKIEKVASGERPFTGDTSSYGFYEPGSVVKITAPKAKGDKPFLKWASDKGKFDDVNSPSASFTTPSGDVTISAVYGKQPFKLSVTGGEAKPEAPKPGEVVTVTARSDKFFYWKTNSKLIDIAIPTQRSIRFAMPSGDVILIAQDK